jgi:CHAT domain-containing protein/tetratricopeptide (TPR) repeat protein
MITMVPLQAAGGDPRVAFEDHVEQGRSREAFDVGRRLLDNVAVLDADNQLLVERILRAGLSARDPELSEIAAAWHRRFIDEVGLRALATAEVADVLATLHFRAGEFAEAGELFNHVHTVRLEVHGPLHQQTLDAANKLLVVSFQLEDFERALVASEQIYAARRESLGPTHIDTCQSANNRGVILSRLGRSAEAAVLYEEAYHGSLARDPKSEHTFTFGSNLASTLADLGEHDRGLPLLHELYQGARANLGPAYPKTLQLGGLLADKLSKLGHAKEALTVAGEVLDHSERELGAEHHITVEAALRWSNAAIDIGRLDEAGVVVERFYALLSASPAHAGLQRAELAHLRGLMADAHGRYGESDEAYAEALAIREEKLGAGHAVTLVTLGSIAALRWNQGALDEAVELADRALAGFRDTIGDGRPETLRAQHNVVEFLVRAGQNERALELAEAGSIAGRASVGGFHPYTLLLRADVANIHRLLGNRAQSAKEMEDVERDAREHLGVTHDMTLALLERAAIIHQAMGRLDRARGLFEEVVETRTRLQGLTHEGTLGALGNLAPLLRDMGEAKAACEAFEVTYQSEVSRRGPEHPRALKAASNFARAIEACGTSAQGQQLAAESLRVTTARFGEGHPLWLEVAATQSQLLGRNDDIGEAIALQERVVTGTAALFGRVHPRTIARRDTLALLYETDGQTDKALASWRLAITDQAKWLSTNLPGSTTDEQRQLLARFEARTDRLLSLALIEHPDSRAHAEVALSAALSFKGRLMEEELRRGADVPDEQRSLEANVAKLEAQLGRLSAAPPSERDVRWQTLWRSTQEARSEVVQRAARDAAYVGASNAPTSTDLAQRLAPETRLVEYILFENVHSGQSHYGVFVLSSEGLSSWADLGPAKRIDVLAETLLNGLSEAGSPWRMTAAALWEALLKPVQSAISGADRVWFATDGTLALVPLGLLVDPAGTAVLDAHRLSTLSSGRELMFTPPEGSPSPAVILAAPDYDAPRPVPIDEVEPWVEFEGPVWRELSHAQVEGRRVARALPGSVLYLGTEASEKRLRALAGPRVLHLATHGYVLGAAERDRSVLLRGPARHRGGVTELGDDTMEPLLRTGIVLAGANRQHPDGRDDGYLTALEVAGLDLRGTELVVLSACNTGAGVATKGEGVVGLRLALQLTGSRAQVLSSWPVTDRATAVLMSHLYTGIQQGLEADEALWQAQQALRSKARWRHPHYWGAFQVSGVTAQAP